MLLYLNFNPISWTNGFKLYLITCVIIVWKFFSNFSLLRFGGSKVWNYFMFVKCAGGITFKFMLGGCILEIHVILLSVLSISNSVNTLIVWKKFCCILASVLLHVDLVYNKLKIYKVSAPGRFRMFCNHKNTAEANFFHWKSVTVSLEKYKVAIRKMIQNLYFLFYIFKNYPNIKFELLTSFQNNLGATFRWNFQKNRRKCLLQSSNTQFEGSNLILW
jgi:hypothetical protein